MSATPRRLSRKIAAGAVAATATLSLAACGGNPLQDNANASGHSSAAGSGATITIGSANFTEDQLLAKIYAKALKAHGVKVDKRPNIGSREVYIKALKDHSIDMIPEYTGNLLDYFSDGNPPKVTAPQPVYQALKKATPDKVEVLQKAAAQDKDTLTVRSATAKQYHLQSIADLQGHAKDFVIGAPPEFKTRYAGLAGLKKVYGLTFKRLKQLSSGTLRVRALTGGQVQVADIFSTNPSIEKKHLVTLDDPKNLFTSQNIVPLIRKSKVTPKVEKVLNAVSAKLTTENLSAALSKVKVDKANPDTVAEQFLEKNGLA
jgi:osmoprotectant transport system substrate-binding protein